MNNSRLYEYPSGNTNIDHGDCSLKTITPITSLLQNGSDNRNGPYTCEKCCKSFKTKQKLTHHMDSHDESKKFICDYPDCDRRYRSSTLLKNHKNSHKDMSIKTPTSHSNTDQNNSIPNQYYPPQSVNGKMLETSRNFSQMGSYSSKNNNSIPSMNPSQVVHLDNFDSAYHHNCFVNNPSSNLTSNNSPVKTNIPYQIYESMSNTNNSLDYSQVVNGNPNYFHANKSSNNNIKGFVNVENTIGNSPNMNCFPMHPRNRLPPTTANMSLDNNSSNGGGQTLGIDEVGLKAAYNNDNSGINNFHHPQNNLHNFVTNSHQPQHQNHHSQDITETSSVLNSHQNFSPVPNVQITKTYETNHYIFEMNNSQQDYGSMSDLTQHYPNHSHVYGEQHQNLCPNPGPDPSTNKGLTNFQDFCETLQNPSAGKDARLYHHQQHQQHHESLMSDGQPSMVYTNNMMAIANDWKSQQSHSSSGCHTISDDYNNTPPVSSTSCIGQNNCFINSLPPSANNNYVNNNNYPQGNNIPNNNNNNYKPNSVNSNSTNSSINNTNYGNMMIASPSTLSSSTYESSNTVDRFEVVAYNIGCKRGRFDSNPSLTLDDIEEIILNDISTSSGASFTPYTTNSYEQSNTSSNFTSYGDCEQLHGNSNKDLVEGDELLHNGDHYQQQQSLTIGTVDSTYNEAISSGFQPTSISNNPSEYTDPSALTNRQTPGPENDNVMLHRHQHEDDCCELETNQSISTTTTTTATAVQAVPEDDPADCCGDLINDDYEHSVEDHETFDGDAHFSNNNENNNSLQQPYQQQSNYCQSFTPCNYTNDSPPILSG